MCVLDKMNAARPQWPENLMRELENYLLEHELDVFEKYSDAILSKNQISMKSV